MGFKYRNRTKNLKLTIGIDTIEVLRWYVNALFMVHDDCRGHTGATLTMGKGSITSFSCKHKLNGKGSTKSVLIVVDYSMPQMLWHRYFITAQGYGVT